MSFSAFFRNLFYSAPAPLCIPETAQKMEDSVAALDRDRKRTLTDIITLSKMDSDFNNVFEPVRARSGISR